MQGLRIAGAGSRRVPAEMAWPALVSLLFVLLFQVSSAHAAVSHAFSGSIGAATSSPADPYPISGPTDVEIDQATNDIYVTDPGNHRIEKFDSSGNFLLMFGKDVNLTTGGNLCPVSPTDVCQAGESSSSPGGFKTPEYLAVDNYPAGHGDLYVADTGDDVVQKFDSSGQIVSSWGASGQKAGTDTDITSFGALWGVAVGGPNGDLYVGGNGGSSDNVLQYTRDGNYEGPYQNLSGSPWLKADIHGNLYFQRAFDEFFGPPTVWKATLRPNTRGEYESVVMGTEEPVTGFNFDPSSQELYQDTGSEIAHYGGDCEPVVFGPCSVLDSFGSGHLSSPMGVGVDGETHTVYVANSGGDEVAVFGDVRPIVNYAPPSEVTQSSLTLNATVDPAGRGAVTACRFEIGFDKSYGTVLPCVPDPAANPPASDFTSKTDVSAAVSGLSPNTKDHYRIVVSNAAGATIAGSDQTFITTSVPSVDGLASANLTATTGDLQAQVNPDGLETHYRFEYGPTINYGQTAPVPDGVIPAAFADQEVEVHLLGLEPSIVYHYRLVATNDDGVTTSEDHTFNFFPPSCPNANVRQQTQANYLPDCRAYELVSAANAGGTQLYTGGPNSGAAISPPRFSYTGLWSTIPEAGGQPIDSTGDLYVATRTATGWKTRYVGLPATQFAASAGPPQGLPGSANDVYGGGVAGSGPRGAAGLAIYVNQNSVLADPSMSLFLQWDEGNQAVGDTRNPTPMASNAPYLLSSEGTILDRWPTNLESVPAGLHTHVGPKGEEVLTQAGGSHALDCPPITSFGGTGAQTSYNACPGDVTASEDLSHFVFSTEWSQFTPDGQLTPPGSVYDNNIGQNRVSLASRLANGSPIPSEPGDQVGDPLQIPAVSSDGSRILMAAGVTGPCGSATCETSPCGNYFGSTPRCPMQPSHLYMRADEAVTYDVSQGHGVKYVGMTSNGSTVYFTSPEQLTTDDHDSSVDLYSWSLEKEKAGEPPLTLISVGSSGEGNSNSCTSDFTTACGVVPYSGQAYCQLTGGRGGNCRSDSSIASENGDIYFFSPELLDGSRGIPNQKNLYLYRNGALQYVTTLTTDSYCVTVNDTTSTTQACSNTPIVRMQVTPDDAYMAFVTASQVTGYENAGHLEMYRYQPSTRQIVCVSCRPDGQPPVSNVEASQDGLFMTDDGRVFFSTEDSLAHGDTNQAEDVYEFVGGRQQLITPGTGGVKTPPGTIEQLPGLIGVSSDGTDAYFSTFETLVKQDHNGLFLKFYDARSGGGFPAPAEPPPCEAADECHGSGSTTPGAAPDGTEATLVNGNAPKSTGSRSSKHHKKHKARRRGQRGSHRARRQEPTRGASR